MEINAQKAGMALGGFAGLLHLVWALLVALGFAQPLMDFIFSLHFIRHEYTIEPFRFGTAVLLVVVTFAVGYLFGWLFATIWNRLQKGKM